MRVKKILIIDDENLIADMISDFCESLGFETLVLNGGESVLTIVKTFKPDLITLDLMMPGVSGVDVMRTLKNDEETQSIPIIIISAVASSAAIQELITDCKSVLQKPIQINTLKKSIDKALPAF